MNEYDLLSAAAREAERAFSDNLVGVYAHGSIAFRCFHWETGDVDFLIVVKEAPLLPQKAAYIRALLALDKEAPKKGLEMSVVRLKVCKSFVYPTPFELHFSNMHKARCAADVEAFCEAMHGADADLAAHFTVTRAAGFAVVGPPVSEVFGAVPREDYLDSIRRDIRDAAADIRENPTYCVLNLCRVLAFTLDGAVLSKAKGGAWGITRLPPKYRALLSGALNAYASGAPFAPEEKDAQAFVKHMTARIFTDGAK